MPPSSLLPCFTSSAARLVLPSTTISHQHIVLSAAALARIRISSSPEIRRAFCTTTTAGMAASGSVSERIIPRLLNIYGSRATARDFEIYAPNATFEDPLMRAHGVKQIKSAFYTLPKVFGESKIVEYTVQENPTGPGKTEVLIDNKQHYKVLGRPVDLTSLITLQVEDGRVVKHEDWWEKKPLKSRETVAGRLAEATRRGAMLLTHALMGFGKDPTQSGTSPA